ncbi:hypothetical protein TDB9533_04321 [Thalassocella blandensis]|nr:hypothetical protein TDB9533_04321 [Thalassocella blandensis]
MTTPIDAQTDPLTESFQQYHRDLILLLCDHIKTTPPFNVVSNIEQDTDNEADAQSEERVKQDSINSGDDAELQELMLEKVQILENPDSSHQDLAEAGQWLISTIISAFPHITPYVSRNLYWYFGGDCMHFLGDEEIARFQAIDEAMYLARQADIGPKRYEHILHQIAGESHNMH